jgi:CRP-like cAMP-binding protein
MENAISDTRTSSIASALGEADSNDNPRLGARAPDPAVRNLLLDALAPDDLNYLRGFLKPVELKRSMILQDTRLAAEYGYFLESGVVSNVLRSGRDGTVEISMVGRTGLVGIATVLGSRHALHRSYVQIPGKAQRISSSDFARAMEERPSIRSHMLRYVQSLIMQLSQTTLCNAKHATEQKIVRWLLLAQDLCGSEFLPITHDQLAMLLNARRASVSEVLARLELDGIVSRSRGVIFVRDRSLTLRRTCSCYNIISESTSWLRADDRRDRLWHFGPCEPPSERASGYRRSP